MEPGDLIDLLQLRAGLITFWWGNATADNNWLAAFGTPGGGVIFVNVETLVVFTDRVRQGVHQWGTDLSIGCWLQLGQGSSTWCLWVFAENLQSLAKALGLFISVGGDCNRWGVVGVVPGRKRRTFGHIANF